MKERQINGRCGGESQRHVKWEKEEEEGLSEVEKEIDGDRLGSLQCM